MKKLILTLTFVITSITFLFAQTPPARTWYNNKVVKERWYENANGQKHGKYIMYDESGNMLYYGNYSNNKQTGVWYDRDGGFLTFINGVLSGPSNSGGAKGNYKNNEKHGYWTERSYDGVVASGNYINGKRDGKWLNIKMIISDNESLIMKGYSTIFKNGKVIEKIEPKEVADIKKIREKALARVKVKEDSIKLIEVREKEENENETRVKVENERKLAEEINKSQIKFNYNSFVPAKSGYEKITDYIKNLVTTQPLG